jgi:two-component system chemotaxis response regulator CheY
VNYLIACKVSKISTEAFLVGGMAMAMQLRYLESGNNLTSAGKENPLAGKTVVVVDDSQFQRRKLRELYESMGFRCIGEAANGLDGFTVCERLKPDLVSLDILMPVMHGVEALGYIRETDCARHVVLVSAIPSLEEVSRLRPKGQMPDAIFSKKDSRETFREVLTNIFLAESLLTKQPEKVQEKTPAEVPSDEEAS